MMGLEQMRSHFSWMSKESGFLSWKLLLVKTVGMTTKHLEYYINLVTKAEVLFERTEPAISLRLF